MIIDHISWLISRGQSLWNSHGKIACSTPLEAGHKVFSMPLIFSHKFLLLCNMVQGFKNEKKIVCGFVFLALADEVGLRELGM